MSKNSSHQSLSIHSLKPYTGHPFEPYEGQRFFDMVESVRAHGVMVPVIVRPISEGKYEILSGHNRCNAAKEAGLETVPAIVCEGLTDDEACFIVTETNLIQRSFADMSHSERAVALTAHHSSIKKQQGYRSDLLSEIEDLTSSPVGTKLKTRDNLGTHYGLSKNTIARYLRIDKLIKPLQKCLDSKNISVRAGVSLSYLRESEQEVVAELLANGTKISMKQAETLREESEKGDLKPAQIQAILKPGGTVAKPKAIRLDEQFLSEYFIDGQSPKEIEDTVAKALKLYFSQQ